jgi:cellobiose phosphorylase
MSSNGSFKSEYGYFTEDGREYMITRPDTPKPWVNVISNGDYGFVVSQAGGGYSWRSHASLNRITRWNQDLVRDADGRFLYLRDEENGDFWSLTWQPTQPDYEHFECHHKLGSTEFVTRRAGIEARWTLSIAPDAPVEIWRVTLRNLGTKPRRLSLFSYLEWLLGAAPDWHREFHKTFIETAFEREGSVILATKCNWEPPIPENSHWNINWPYVAFHCASHGIAGFETDKQAFLGQYGSLANPQALRRAGLQGITGRWVDAIASIQITLNLAPNAEETAIFVLGAADDRAQALDLAKRFMQPQVAEAALTQTHAGWQERTSRLQVESPDPALNLMTNNWLIYQTISCRLWGRSAYYQTGGAFGFRDQLQDSLIFLLLGQAELTLAQIRLHARHQFVDGSVHHWWHPLPALGAEKEIESGVRTKISDNRLWLCYVMARYLEETADFSTLDLTEPFVDDPMPHTLWEHCLRALNLALETLSPRGLPLIGGGDWNDGLNAVGVQGKGESVWLGHFLFGLLNDFANYAEHRGEASLAQRYRESAAALRDAINQVAWDGEWYWRATNDKGELLGSHLNPEGRIFLNAQTWAILSNTASPERAAQVWGSLEKWLLKDYGPLLLYPAYHTPDPAIGYLSRYAPGIRENGGVYTHAATWALLAACRLGLREKAYDLYRRICPPVRGLDPELYQGEPYVTPGNVDGPDSPNYGRGAWTWYSGSAQWLLRVTLDGLFGLHPTLDGLCIAPCLPPDWKTCRVKRYFRGSLYEIEYRDLSGTKVHLTLDGNPVDGDTLPLPTRPIHHAVVTLE